MSNNRPKPISSLKPNFNVVISSSPVFTRHQMYRLAHQNIIILLYNTEVSLFSTNEYLFLK